MSIPARTHLIHKGSKLTMMFTIVITKIMAIVTNNASKNLDIIKDVIRN